MGPKMAMKGEKFDTRDENLGLLTGAKDIDTERLPKHITNVRKLEINVYITWGAAVKWTVTI